jgi:ribosomal protein L37AE/L43A
MLLYLRIYNLFFLKNIVMPQQLRNLIITFTGFILIFILVRSILLPKSFGELGHYRKDALKEIGDLPTHYIGSQICSNCHEDKVLRISEGVHAKLKCELCHGPAKTHATYADTIPGKVLADSLKLFRQADRKFCATCHAINMARIKIKNDTINQSVIHQVDVKVHNLLDDENKEQNCIECHNPHDPW